MGDQTENTVGRPAGSKFFGRLTESFALSEPTWFSALRMTATATIYTPFGFAIAADGRQRWEHRPTRDTATREAESDAAQKIFEIKTGQAALAYIVQGHIANRDRSFDLVVELRNRAALLSVQNFENCDCFLRTLLDGVEQEIESAMWDRRLESYPDAQISFVGYFQDRPHWTDIHFLSSRNFTGSLYEAISNDLYPGRCFVSGSLLIRDLIVARDPRFSRFCKRIDRTVSLEDAADFVKGYVEACGSPLALEVDAGCEEIGGHIHVAVVTPADSLDRSGFQWLTRPLP
jgi:hypothetical protein